jgi:death on curing protein
LVFRLTTAYVEMIHDEVVASPTFWPGSEPVSSAEYRDFALLDSAVNRPFQSFGGRDCYPSLFGKAAALFHSLTCNHCFQNGNKRTALVAMDLFLTANSVCLLAANSDVYDLATATASHNQRGLSSSAALTEIQSFLKNNAVPFKLVFETVRQYRREDQEPILQFVQSIKQSRREIRTHPLNRQTTE